MNSRVAGVGILGLIVLACQLPGRAEGAEDDVLSAVTVLLVRGRVADAASTLEAAAQDGALAREPLARAGAVVAMCGGRLEEAERRLGGALGAEPQSAGPTHVLLGDLRLAAGDTGGALLHYRSALASPAVPRPADEVVLAWGTRRVLSRARAVGLDSGNPATGSVRLAVATYIELDEAGRQLLASCEPGRCQPEQRIADLARLSWISAAAGFYDDALRWQGEALAAAELLGQSDRSHAVAEGLEMAAVHLAAGHSSEALQRFRAASEELARRPDADPELRVVPLEGCLRAARAAGDRDGERECRRQLRDLQRARSSG